MRKIIILMLLALIAMGIAPFFLKDKNGRPLLGINDIKLPLFQLPELPDINSTTSSPKVQVYRWRDGNGRWQFSNTAPEGKDFEVMEVDANMNRVPAVQQNPTPKPDQSDKPASKTSTTILPDMSLPYSAKQVQQLIGDAKAISSTAEERKKNLDQAINAQQ